MSNFAHFGTECTYCQLYMCVQGSPAEIQTPEHWNLTGRNMIAQVVVLSPSSILPPPSHYAVIATRKISKRVSRMIFLQFYCLLILKIGQI